MAGKFGLRVLAEGLLWLPLWLIFSANAGLAGKTGLAAGILLCIVAGLGFNRLPPLWGKILLVAITLAMVGVGVARNAGDLPVLIWMCAALWRGRFVRFGYWQYGFAFGVCCLALIAITLNEAWTGYRTAIVVLAVLWLLGWFVALNRSMIEGAGLGNGIVTRPVLRSSRKYAIFFIGIGVLAIIATIGYGEKWMTPRKVDVSPILADFGWDLEQEPDKDDFLEKLKGEPVEPHPIWDYLFWIIVPLATAGFLWFVRLLWKDRTWTWRSLLNTIREWFIRGRREEEPPYIEERRSLRKEKKTGRGRFGALFRKPSRPGWEQLGNPEKVRRLYEEAVTAGIRQGFVFRATDTPSETLEGIERWRSEVAAAAGNERKDAYWDWFRRIKEALAGVYGKARYSPREITSQEVEELRTGR